MKKMIALLSVMVLSSAGVWAQKEQKDLDKRVASGVRLAAAVAPAAAPAVVGILFSQESIKSQQKHILWQLDSFRHWVGTNTLSNSFILQNLMGIMDSYLALADENESAAVALNEELNKPIVRNGGYDKFTLKGFVTDHGCEILSDQENFERFVKLLGKKNPAVDHAEKNIAAMPGFLRGEYEAAVNQEAAKTFGVYFAANPNGEVQEAAYKPLAELLTAAIGLNRMIARTPNVDDREDYAIQWFFDNDIPGKYAALKVVNPELAAATNELMRSFMDTVSNGTFYGGAKHSDMQAMRAFNQAIGYR